MDKNQVIIIGNLGDDPKHFDNPDKTEFAAFFVATNLQFKSANGDMMEETEWHRVVAFGWRASVASHFHKGERVYVEGYVRTRKYEKDEGEGYVKEIVAQLLYPIRTLPKAGPAERPIPQPARSMAHPAGSETAPPAREGALY